MDFAQADRATLETALRDPRFGEPMKERIRARLQELSAPAVPVVTEKPTPAGKRRGVPNQTEQRYAADVLEPMKARGEILRYEFEGITFFIPDLGRYTPDWVLWLPDLSIAVHEVKGAKLWPNEIQKFKASAKERPWIPHRMIQWKDGRWTVLHDRNSSLGTAPVA